MAELFKGWITTIFCIGIFITFVQMILPDTKLKKYIYSLIGVITLIALILPIKGKINIGSLEEITQSVINNIDQESYKLNDADIEAKKDVTSENLKKEFSKKLKEDMKMKLSDYNVYPEMVSVILDDNYNIKRVNIKIKPQNDIKNINTIFNCISKNYSVLDDNITIEEV